MLQTGVVGARKRHQQQSFEFRTWGGKRKRAGRKQVKARKSQPHRKRAEVKPTDAVLVSLRVADDVARLRRRDAYRAIRAAMVVVLSRADFRIVHASIQGNHIHLLAEASNRRALWSGLQAFQISAARRLNAVDFKATRRAARRGGVFPDRYRADVISVPRRARHALAYVLNNWRRHKEDRAYYAKVWEVDPYSSGTQFVGWKEGAWRGDIPDDPVRGETLPVCPPQTWLLREGWKLAGTISAFEVPGPK